MNHDRVLVAGIGNIFHGDDAFGCEVARRLTERPPMAGVRVVDFGIRSYDLAFAIMEPWDLVILVDAIQRGGAPGSLYVIEPDLATLNADHSPIEVETHSVQPLQVLRLVKAFGGAFPKLLLLGCEPADLGESDDGKMGLSDTVRAAVGQAPTLIETLISRHLVHSPSSGDCARPLAERFNELCNQRTIE